MPAAQPQVVLDAGACDGVIFDMDGVLTDTATVHARAWKQMFDDYLRRRAERRGGDFEPFDVGSDYPRYVDGRPRYDGVRSFLESRGIELPDGAPDDPPNRETVCGLGNRKNDLFLERLRDEGVGRFEDGVDLVAALRGCGIRTAVISASENAREVLEGAGLFHLFPVRVDGLVAGECRLEGKPAPDVFLEAARRLGIEPGRGAVVEDALAGVRAGRAGGFRWVIGVARSGGGDALREAGATAVVHRLSEIEVRGRSGGGSGPSGEGRGVGVVVRGRRGRNGASYALARSWRGPEGCGPPLTVPACSGHATRQGAARPARRALALKACDRGRPASARTPRATPER